MSDPGEVRYRRDGDVAHIVFDRPAARNAMTWGMYEGLAAACRQAAADGVRVAVLRGAGGKAFIAGTDIAQFQSFQGGEDGVDYERKVARYLGCVESLPMPTLAVIEGWAIGGGLAIAAVCDLRVATPGTRFGVPIARTVGNCLAIENIALLNAVFGISRVKKMLLLAENLTTEEALASGFLAEVVAPEGLEARIADLCARLAGNAPITLRVTKEAIRRLLQAGMPAGEDLVRETYASRDFKEGVAAFVAKRPPTWSGA